MKIWYCHSNRDQNSKLHKRLIFTELILVRFCVFVFWWQKNSFRSELKFKVGE